MIGQKVGIQKLQDYAERFGLGTASGIQLIGEAPGSLPSPQYNSRLESVSRYLGRGVKVTPLQITMAMAVIANGGRLMLPRTIGMIRDEAGKELSTFKPELVRTVISESTAQKIASALHEVSFPTNSPARELVGVTGIAEKVVRGAYVRDVRYCWFVGFTPIQSRKL
jgi:cell division protein FtsI/penicillin-binding protein 2